MAAWSSIMLANWASVSMGIGLMEQPPSIVVVINATPINLQ
jgi:hypothetical protein